MKNVEHCKDITSHPEKSKLKVLCKLNSQLQSSFYNYNLHFTTQARKWKDSAY